MSRRRWRTGQRDKPGLEGAIKNDLPRWFFPGFANKGGFQPFFDKALFQMLDAPAGYPRGGAASQSNNARAWMNF
jgi:hypothetical protein